MITGTCDTSFSEEKKDSVYTVVMVGTLNFAVTKFRQIITGFPVWQPGSCLRSSHARFLVD
jgi:hypothetical protein